MPLCADDAFIRDALTASGSGDACETAQRLAVYAELREAVLCADDPELPLTERLAALHSALHEQILIGDYQPAASDMRQTLARGDYNCLSAAALFWDVCQAVGIDLEIWSRPGHVWLQTADGLAIEAASVSALARRMHPFAARQITPQQLLGKFYYNRGVELLAQDRYAAGLELMRAAQRLDPADDDARENLLAGLNNWAAEHLRLGRYAQAAQLIRQGLAIQPDYGPLVANQRLLP
jgi:tetratricopeptide (TPR) repeat protein